jgi:hypothetical protein
LLLIYCSNITPRVNYIFKYIIGDLSGFEYNITLDKSKYISYEGPSLNYSSNPIKEREIRYLPCDLLYQSSIVTIRPVLEKRNETIAFLFPFEKEKVLLSDPFAAAFYLLSRYEEYLPFTPDSFNRFEASASIIYSFGLLNRPLVNEWAGLIKKQILEVFPSLHSARKKFSPIISIDIDQAFAFKHRGFLKNVLSFNRNLFRFKKEWLIAQLQTIFLNQKDPFDTYSYLKKMHYTTGLQFVYFINVGKYSKFDKNLRVRNKALQELVKDLNTYAQIGLHPSFFTNEMPEKLEAEKRSIDKITNNTIIKSRQHYLKLKFPGTYRNLLKVGIKEDYSMGYASKTGFRAGVCSPFYWFDLEKNCETELKVFPITFMDGTLAEDLYLTPNDALEQINTLIDVVKKHDGCFLTIWHNHTINDQFSWMGWKIVFEQIIDKLKA